MVAAGMDALLSPAGAHEPDRGRAGRVRERRGRRPCCRCTSTPTRSSPRHGIATFHFGTDSGATSTVGEALAGLVQRELRGPHRDARLPGAPRLGHPAADPDAGRAGRDGLPVQPRRTAPAARPGVPQHRRRGLLVAVKRLYLDGQDDQPTGTFTFSDLLARERERDPAEAV